LPDGPAPGEVPPAPQPGATRVLLVHKDAPAVAVSMGYPVDFNRSDPDFPALMVALSAFGEHRQFNGRLMQRLREMRGLNYGDYAYAEYFHQEGWSTFAATNIGRSQQFFSIWLRPIENDKALFGVRAALHEYDLLLGAGLTDAEVDTTKRFLAGYTRLWEKNDSRRLGYLLDDDFYGTPNRLEQVRAALPSITTEQVNAAIHKHLQPAAALRIVLVAQDAAKLRDAMVANTPSPITYNSAKPPELLQQDQEIIARPFGVGVEAVRIVEAAELFER
jgi:zinc protease